MENAYLNAPCVESIWFVGGNEYGEDKGLVLLIVRNLYGIKYADFSLRSASAEALREIGLKPKMEDPNV